MRTEETWICLPLQNINMIIDCCKPGHKLLLLSYYVRMVKYYISLFVLVFMSRAAQQTNSIILEAVWQRLPLVTSQICHYETSNM